MVWGYVLLGILLIAVPLLFISYQKKSAALKHLQTELNSLENIIANTNDALFVIEIVNGNLLHTNESASRLLGYSNEELKSRTYFSLFPKEYIQKSAEIIADVWENKGMVFNTIPYQHKNGELIPIECSAKIGSFDEHPAIVIYARDIRERLKYENEIKQINSELQDKNKEIIDSIQYARRIQNALMASEKNIEKALKRLKGN
jgi:PAS domain S-box-containing protein